MSCCRYAIPVVAPWLSDPNRATRAARLSVDILRINPHTQTVTSSNYTRAGTTAAPLSLDPADQADLDVLFASMADAWSRGDGKAYGDLFTPHAHYVNAPGQRVVGAENIGRTHQQIFDSFFRGTRLGSGYPRELEPVAPGVVLIHASGAVLFTGEQEQNVAPNGLMTMLLVKRDDRWLIDSFTNTQTGKGRNVRFFARYLASRVRSFTAEWKKARRHLLVEKQRNIAEWAERGRH
ncbi:MAG: SgcJ/EcaC family oxidoreductase [Candidatus Dormibacteraceae bacterium]